MISELEIIRILTGYFKSTKQLPLGFRDDVAAFPLPTSNWVILKTDMLIGSTDVPPGMSLVQAARKSVVATVSDFAAKGVQPRALLVSLGLPNSTNRSTVVQLGRGLSEAAKEYGCKIIGGDTSNAQDLIINVVGVGFAKPSKVIRRDGARPGDIVAVTGVFGKSSAGLRILLSGSHHTRRFPSLVKAVLQPVARLGAGIQLAKTRAATSAIDSSDGLAWSLYEIAGASHVDILVETIPVGRDVQTYAKLTSRDPRDLALYGGEEYEIVTTIRKRKYDLVKRRIPSLIRIGTVESGRGKVHDFTDTASAPILPKGYDHFTDRRI